MTKRRRTRAKLHSRLGCKKGTMAMIANIIVLSPLGECKELQRMSDMQKRKAVALIKSLCCNYDGPTGSCLVLSGWEDTPCPQCSSNSLMCRHFRDVLLEDKAGKELKAAIMSCGSIKTCQVCGKPFRAVSNRAKYCQRCAEKVGRQKATARKRRQREGNVTV